MLISERLRKGSNARKSGSVTQRCTIDNIFGLAYMGRSYPCALRGHGQKKHAPRKKKQQAMQRLHACKKSLCTRALRRAQKPSAHRECYFPAHVYLLGAATAHENKTLNCSSVTADESDESYGVTVSLLCRESVLMLGCEKETRLRLS